MNISDMIQQLEELKKSLRDQAPTAIGDELISINRSFRNIKELVTALPWVHGLDEELRKFQEAVTQLEDFLEYILLPQEDPAPKAAPAPKVAPKATAKSAWPPIDPYKFKGPTLDIVPSHLITEGIMELN